MAEVIVKIASSNNCKPLIHDVIEVTYYSLDDNYDNLNFETGQQ